MREVNVRKLRECLAIELRDLPFLITRHGEVVAVCRASEDCPECKGGNLAAGMFFCAYCGRGLLEREESS